MVTSTGRRPSRSTIVAPQPLRSSRPVRTRASLEFLATSDVADGQYGVVSATTWPEPGPRWLPSHGLGHESPDVEGWRPLDATDVGGRVPPPPDRYWWGPSLSPTVSRVDRSHHGHSAFRYERCGVGAPPTLRIDA